MEDIEAIAQYNDSVQQCPAPPPLTPLPNKKRQESRMAAVYKVHIHYEKKRKKHKNFSTLSEIIK